MIDDARFWFDVFQWVVMGALALYVRLRKPGEDAGKAVGDLREQVDARLQDHSHRITGIEAHMKHMPTSDELRVVDGLVKQIGERVQGLSDGLAPMRNTLTRIESYLLNSRLSGPP